MNEVVNIIAMQNHTEISILVIIFLLKLFWVRCTFIFIPDEKIVLLKAVQEIVTIGFLCSVYIFLLVLSELFDEMSIIGEVHASESVIDL